MNWLRGISAWWRNRKRVRARPWTALPVVTWRRATSAGHSVPLPASVGLAERRVDHRHGEVAAVELQGVGQGAPQRRGRAAVHPVHLHEGRRRLDSERLAGLADGYALRGLGAGGPQRVSPHRHRPRRAVTALRGLESEPRRLRLSESNAKRV